MKPPVRLPTSVLDHRPIPTLPEPQGLTLSDVEYQSIAQSAVVRISLDRSRQRWTKDGIFARYWVKPTMGKNAKAPPEGNPDFKWMKEKGECRIRVEPHIFEVLLYVEEKPVPKPIPPPKQYIPPMNHGAYTQQQPYRPQPLQQPPYTHPNQPYHVRPLPPASHQTPPPRPPQASSKPHEPETKKPDPVISMLAARAQADPQLKSLMKEVANGNASQDQLRVFQRHIDELTKIINKQKDDEGETTQQAAVETGSQNSHTMHDGAADSRNSTPVQHQPPQPAPLKPYQTPQQPPPMYHPQPAQTWTPPAAPSPPACKPVVMGFKSADATEDRFLFPQHSILESLSPNHTLASFIVTRKGREAVDNTAGLDHFKEYWQPVTVMVEVPNGRESLMQHIRDWIRPADEVRKHMQEVMARCIRAPETHLAIRLPIKGSKEAETEDMVRRSETPVMLEDKPRKKNVVYVKKATMGAKEASAVGLAQPKKGNEKSDDTSITTHASEPQSKLSEDVSTASAPHTTDAAAVEEPATIESGRPKRTVRKSVRISSG